MQSRKLFISAVMILNALLPIAARAEAGAGNTVNFRFSPVEVLIGSIHINFDFTIAPSWTLGPELLYSRYTTDSDSIFTSKYTISSFGGGARANWFNNGAYVSGLYVGPSLTIQTIEVKAEDSIGNVKANSTIPILSSVVGYGWFWNSFNMMLGGGLAFPLGNPKIKVTDSTGTQTSVRYSRFSGLALEYSLGWTF